MQTLLTTWAADYGGSKYGNIATQYYDVVGGKHVYPTNPKNNSTVWVDNTNAEPAHATDAQIQAEAWAFVNSQQGGHSDPNGAYIVNSSYNHDPQGFLSSGWCAYHGASQSGNSIISYTNEPYMSDAGQDCGASFISAPSDETAADEGATIVIGHEYNESVSDPQPIQRLVLESGRRRWRCLRLDRHPERQLRERRRLHAAADLQRQDRHLHPRAQEAREKRASRSSSSIFGEVARAGRLSFFCYALG